tara:strand:+ start:9389 stop:9976 length:588 start_codon:yes stop_codon:yes gene_type:complete
MKEKINQLTKIVNHLTAVELAFFNSVKCKTSFSPPQTTTINHLYSKYCEDGWRTNYDDRKRRIMKSCAEFWVNNPPKLSELAAQVLNNPDFVPTKDQYKEMCESKEARNFLNPEGAKPLYPAGSLVKVSRISSGPGQWGEAFIGKFGVVIRVRKNEQVYPSHNSDFLYHVLLQGSTGMMMFPERDIKLIEVQNES